MNTALLRLLTAGAAALVAVSAQALTLHRSFNGGYPAGTGGVRQRALEQGGVVTGGGAKRVTKTGPAGQAKAPNRLIGRVSEVADGDLLTVSVNGSAAQKVKLWKVDAPEPDQPFGPEAKKFLSDLVSGKDVEVLWEKRDAEGRILGVVYYKHPQGMVEVNLTLVKNGAAWHDRRNDGTKVYADSEREAKRAKRGLWGAEAPVDPYVWRQKAAAKAKTEAKAAAGKSAP